MRLKLLATVTVSLLAAFAVAHGGDNSTFNTGGKTVSPYQHTAAPDKSKPVAAVVVGIPPEAVSFTAFLMGNPSLVVINGKDYTLGETITLNIGGTVIKAVVQTVKDGVVVLRYNGKDYEIPLKRADKPLNPTTTTLNSAK